MPKLSKNDELPIATGETFNNPFSKWCTPLTIPQIAPYTGTALCTCGYSNTVQPYCNLRISTAKRNNEVWTIRFHMDCYMNDPFNSHIEVVIFKDNEKKHVDRTPSPLPYSLNHVVYMWFLEQKEEIAQLADHFDMFYLHNPVGVGRTVGLTLTKMLKKYIISKE